MPSLWFGVCVSTNAVISVTALTQNIPVQSLYTYRQLQVTDMAIRYIEWFTSTMCAEVLVYITVPFHV